MIFEAKVNPQTPSSIRGSKAGTDAGVELEEDINFALQPVAFYLCVKTSRRFILVSGYQMSPATGDRDGVDERREQWARELPDVDTRGMAILGRARRLTLVARSQIDAVLASHGLDAGEADVLFTLLRSGPPYCLRPTELFRSMMVSSGGMTHRLKKLEKAGFIVRRPAEGDSRSLLVELTSLGRRTAEAAFREDMALEAKLLDSLSDAEQAQLATLLHRLETSLAPDGSDWS